MLCLLYLLLRIRCQTAEVNNSYGGAYLYGSLTMEIASLNPFDTYNLMFLPFFVENFCTRGLWALFLQGKTN